MSDDYFGAGKLIPKDQTKQFMRHTVDLRDVESKQGLKKCPKTKLTILEILLTKHKVACILVNKHLSVIPSASRSSSSVGQVCSPSIESGTTSDCSDSWKAGSARANNFRSSSMAVAPSSLSCWG